MKYITKCRRTFVAIFSVCCLTYLGSVTGVDVSGSIATVALAVAASNAAQKAFQKENIEPGIQPGE